MTLFALTDKPLATLDADAIVVGTKADGDGAALVDGHDLPAEAADWLAAALPALGATGKVDDVHALALVPGLAARKTVLAGLSPATGTSTEPTPTSTHAGVGAALRKIGKADTVVLSVPVGDADWLTAAATGAHLGSYSFTAHKSAPEQTHNGRQAKAILIHAPNAKDKDAKAALARAEVLAEATAYARDLVNTPPNALYPKSFVENVLERIKSAKVKLDVTVHDEQALAAMGCGGIVGVGQGSQRPPRIMEVHYRPRHPAGRVAFVGKGITFDSGGLCIKPPAGMLAMKSDMAGAAAVIAAVIAAAQLKLPVGVSGYLCLAENMPSGTAQRPSDVVTMRNGKTVEIIDTDAEGRMVLGDGLALAAESDPDAILDIATLTGACMIALGVRVAGVMSNDEHVNDAVLSAALTSGEAMWPLPLPEELRSKLDSTTADLQHKGDQWGGALTAGLFLREFVTREGKDPVPWAHLDIAGPSFNEASAYGATPKGGTGFGVATLLAFAERHAR
ncbi:MAG: leucyl aminopeptidase [Tetrasphaera sp.]